MQGADLNCILQIPQKSRFMINIFEAEHHQREQRDSTAQNNSTAPFQEVHFHRMRLPLMAHFAPAIHSYNVKRALKHFLFPNL